MSRSQAPCNSQKIAALLFPYPYLVSGGFATLASGCARHAMNGLLAGRALANMKIHLLSAASNISPRPSASMRWPAVHRLKLSSAGRLPSPWKRLITEIAISCDMSQTLDIQNES
jgi:hypothetical protein